ncbi:MAG TPA: nitroreductase/quinone reductase family protein [Acidimicrobiia bacterium]|nr:nitroreductase/quinone reductase family protein [Acidimicrobiia bacterium]
MPMPLWWGRVNKRIFNPRALENGRWKVLNHVGRISGRRYRTPLDAVEVDGTFVFILVYGSRADWVQNSMASGSATLETGDETIELVAPRLTPEETARPMLRGSVTLPPRLLGVEYLQMDISSRAPASR